MTGVQTCALPILTFYLVNEFGRIRAVQTRPYIGVFDFYVQDLTFVEPMPVPPPTPTPNPTPRPTPTPTPTPTLSPTPTPRPTPTASLPIAGDPALARLPKIALMVGAVAVVLGGGLLFSSRRTET